MNIYNIRNFLFDKIKESILKGNITGLNRIPDDDTVYKYIDDLLNKSDDGIIGSINIFEYKKISEHKKYNQNFITIKDNIEFILSDIFDSLNKTIDIINDSRIEHNKVIRDIKLIERDFSDIEQGALHNDGLKYIVSDTFLDTDKVDVNRTTAQLNLNAGNVSLNSTTANNVQFSHYRNQKSINFVVNEGYDKIKSQQQTPESFFGGIFDSDYTDRWEVVITTTQPILIEGYITLKLSEVGEAVKINSIIFKTDNIKTIGDNSDLLTFQYTDIKGDNKWKMISGGKVELKTPEVQLDFGEIEATHIRIYWTKYSPDNNDNEYKFSFIELTVKKSLTVYESVIISKPLIVESYRNEIPCIYSTELKTSSKLIDNSTIDYYIATDEPILGKIVDNEGKVTYIDSDDAYAFVPNGIDSEGKLETYYTYASILRDHPEISGSLLYQNWQPKWQQIKPLNQNGTMTSTLFFNVSDFNKEVHDLYYTNPILWGDPSYTGPWPVTGSDWATDWSGTGDAPKSGYIWGENPFTAAGVWWGDSSEFPGWWRPFTPTASGTHEYTTAEMPIAIPDYIVPVLDSEDKAVMDEDGNPIQKHFWKIFKWPNGYKPIEGTVKLYNSYIKQNNVTTSTNNTTWKWNYRYNKTIEDYTVTISLDGRKNYYVIQADKLLPNKSDIRILQDSIRDVNFINSTPSEIQNYTVEYGYEYKENNEGLTTRILVDESLQDATATIILSELDLEPKRIINGSNPIEITLTFSYETRSDIIASWDGYLITSDVNTKLKVSSNSEVTKISVQNIDDYGTIIETKIPTNLSEIELYKGLNFVRFFVDTKMSQSNVVNDTLANWRPDYYKITYEDTIKYNNVVNINTSVKNRICSTTDFINDGIVKGVEVIINDDNTKKGIVNKIYSVGSNYYLDIKTDEAIIIETYTIFNFTSEPSISFDGLISNGEGSVPLTEVDINTLMYEIPYDDDSKYALLTDVDNSTYLVVKTPNLNTNGIINNTHYTRNYFDYLTNEYVTFTTGTKGNVNGKPQVVSDGSILSDRPANTYPTVEYPNISTYGATIQVNTPSDSGFLFWNTAENLESVYSIKYAIPANNIPVNRLFFMAKLISSDSNITPVLNSYNIIINDKIKDS